MTPTDLERIARPAKGAVLRISGGAFVFPDAIMRAIAELHTRPALRCAIDAQLGALFSWRAATGGFAGLRLHALATEQRNERVWSLCAVVRLPWDSSAVLDARRVPDDAIAQRYTMHTKGDAMHVRWKHGNGAITRTLRRVLIVDTEACS